MSARRLVPVLLGLLLAAVLPATAAWASASLVLTPQSGPAGSTTVVSGTGFPPSTKGTVTFGRTRVGMRTTAAGTFSSEVTVPASAADGTSIAVRADAGKASATGTFLVRSTAPDPEPEPTPPAPPLAFGISMPSGFYDRGIGGITTMVGEAPTIELAFYDFGRQPDLEGLRRARSRGATPLVTLEPWQAGRGVSQPAYSLDAVARGDHDAVLRGWATAFRDFGDRVLLRFAHEMNGNWYPWAEGVNGNEPGDYVAAWAHVHEVVETAAPNVEWVWAPNVPYSGSTPLRGLFPGDARVDVLGVDGYNFGTSQSWSTWVSPEALFGDGLAQLRALSAKPLVVTETASSELGGSKAAWNEQLVPYLQSQGVTAFVWFHHDKETDWRIDSSSASATALERALAARR